MKIVRYLRVAAESIVAHKLRAILTMLGIIIGVAAVLSTMGIGRGAAASVTERIESQGTNLLSIVPAAASSGGVQGSGSVTTLTIGDAEALQGKAMHPDLVTIAPEYSGNAQLVYGDTNSNSTVAGVTADYAGVRNQEVASGRYLTAEDSQNQEQVAVIGSELASDLFGSENPVGLTFRIDGEPFQVIGVMEEVGGVGRSNPDSMAYVPIEVAQGRLFSADRYRGDYTVTTIYIEVTDNESVDDAMLQIETTLRLRHNLRADEENDFDIYDQASLLETMEEVTGTFTVFLGAIGAVSLLVGGIGIMNIMLVSVTERTREIGLRKAIGAHDNDILLQFLIESLVLCFLGGLIGVGLAFGVAYAFDHIPSLTFTVLIQPDALVLAIGFSLVSGIIFGIYPAWRATQLDPIEALRSE